MKTSTGSTLLWVENRMGNPALTHNRGWERNQKKRMRRRHRPEPTLRYEFTGRNVGIKENPAYADPAPSQSPPPGKTFIVAPDLTCPCS